MLCFIITFFAGALFGVIICTFGLGILSNNKIDETEPDDDGVLNQDGTPKRIVFTEKDHDYEI